MSTFPSSLAVAARQARALEDTAHRPWTLPGGSWLQAQTREDVLFAHWRAEPAALARLLPPGLPLDTYEGEAFVGLVPFRLANLRLRGLPALRRSFPQLDVRTYVSLEGRPGIWLASLEASNPVLVEAAKRAHRLPAYRARISTHAEEGRATSWEVERDGLAFRARARPEGDAFTGAPGSLEHFLVERYCLYTADGGRLYRAELHHTPWRLRRAQAELDEVTLAPVALEGEPHFLHAAEQDVLVWPLEEL